MADTEKENSKADLQEKEEEQIKESGQLLLDENDNGFILNSVHSTEGCYSYTKEIKNGLCDISLGEEEKQALDIAMDL